MDVDGIDDSMSIDEMDLMARLRQIRVAPDVVIPFAAAVPMAVLTRKQRRQLDTWARDTYGLRLRPSWWRRILAHFHR